MSTDQWPPPHPYDTLLGLKAEAAKFEGGIVDLSIGRPCDPPPDALIEAAATSNLERGYPPSIGIAPLRQAASNWMARRFDIHVDPTNIAACVGTKEFVASLAGLLKLRTPERDTVLFPAIAYPTYAMSATLAGLRAVPVPLDENWCIDLSQIDPADAARAMCLWINTPGNPAGGMDDLGAAAEWGRSNNVPVFSDECYIEFTYSGEPRSILHHGQEGVVAVHSLSKRSNFAGGRVGFYAGDAELVHYLSECRKHTGMLVPGPAQAAGAAAFDDDEHVIVQKQVYLDRMTRLVELLAKMGLPAELPGGAFYLWVDAPDGAMALVERLATEIGMIVSPGTFYGPDGANHIRIAAVEPMEKIDLLFERLG